MPLPRLSSSPVCDCWLGAGALQFAVPLSWGALAEVLGGRGTQCWLCSLLPGCGECCVGKPDVDSWACSSSAALGKGRTRSSCLCSAESLELMLLQPAVSSASPSSCPMRPVHLHRGTTDLLVLLTYQSGGVPGAAHVFPTWMQQAGAAGVQKGFTPAGFCLWTRAAASVQPLRALLASRHRSCLLWDKCVTALGAGRLLGQTKPLLLLGCPLALESTTAVLRVPQNGRGTSWALPARKKECRFCLYPYPPALPLLQARDI